jgi:hypothetical protein
MLIFLNKTSSYGQHMRELQFTVQSSKYLFIFTFEIPGVKPIIVHSVECLG